MTGDAELSNLTERQLQAVLTLSRNRSFTAAAAQLGVSQPALTRTILAVETMLGATAFDRTTRSVRMTPVGRELVGAAERIVGDLKRTRERVHAIAALGNRQVVVSALSSCASVLLPAAARRFLDANPGVEVVIREDVHDKVVEEVADGIADVGVAYLSDIGPSLRGEPLTDESFVLVAPPDHPLAGRPVIRIAEIADHPLVSFSPDTKLRRVVDTTAADLGLRLRYVAVTGSFTTTLAFVREGLGATIAPRCALPPRRNCGLSLIPIEEPSLRMAVGIITPTDRALPVLAKAFVSEIRSRPLPDNSSIQASR
jgi:LysR family carnitine catabolism transcriptional activator